MSALVGFFHPVSPKEPVSMAITLSETAAMKVIAPLAPGVIVTVGVESFRQLKIGDRVPVERMTSILALDGEREIPFSKEDEIEIVLSAEGPWIVDVHEAMRFAVAQGAFSIDGSGPR